MDYIPDSSDPSDWFSFPPPECSVGDTRKYFDSEYHARTYNTLTISQRDSDRYEIQSIARESDTIPTRHQPRCLYDLTHLCQDLDREPSFRHKTASELQKLTSIRSRIGTMLLMDVIDLTQSIEPLWYDMPGTRPLHQYPCTEWLNILLSVLGLNIHADIDTFLMSTMHLALNRQDQHETKAFREMMRLKIVPVIDVVLQEPLLLQDIDMAPCTVSTI